MNPNKEFSPTLLQDCFPIPFTKMNGAGNDFIIIDHRRTTIAESDQGAMARLLCRRRFSLGADGLIFIENAEGVDFQWRFYNADGSVAEMCGNGARCAARFAYDKGIARETMRFATIAGIIEAEMVPVTKEVKVKMTRPVECRLDLTLDYGVGETAVASINTGVPHAVIFVDEKDIPVKEWGRKVRHHQLFGPAGTNANFVYIQEDGSLHVRTYERGVEDETMACGTGAVASAIIATLLGKTESPVVIVTSGGEKLHVLFDRVADGVENVLLQGPARVVCEGYLTAEALL